jgi:uncharacterized protein YndB with AHSA1/START domain
MTVIQGTGRVVRDRKGLELIVERRLPAPAEEAWEWLTSSARLKSRIGSFKGQPAVGATVNFTMALEKGAAPEPVRIVRCDRPERFALDWQADDSPWRVTVSLVEIDGATVVYLSQRLSDYREAGTVGPGWEYYLDRLLAAHGGTAMPDFANYFPTQRPYFERLAMDGGLT